MIEPTVGRVVWLYAAGIGFSHDRKQPFAATVAYVFNPRLINVGFTDHVGFHGSLQGVVLLQDGDAKPEGEPFATWMPYQKGQAAKTEALEAKRA